MKHPDEILAIIPARGGSKGIPRKNIRPIAGKPLLAYTIEHARRTPDITRIVVSTDDGEIGAVAEDWGAEVIKRPPELSGDEASSESALLHALDQLRRVEGYDPGLVVFLQATSPLRRPDDIQSAITTFMAEEADSLFSAGPVHGFIWRREAGRLSSFSYDYRNRRRRQDAPEELVENGSIYIFKPQVLRASGNRLGGKIATYLMDPLDSLQVDEPSDMPLFERLLAVRVPCSILPAGSGSVRMLVLDFDGVMTDNRVLVDCNGNEAVWCDRGDGWGIARLKDAGMEIVVLTTEIVPVAAARCRKLGIECIDGCEDKLTALREMAWSRELGPNQIAYVGNDVNDLDCLRWVGLPIAVADAVPEVLAAADWVTARPGGRGAVREVADHLLREAVSATGSTGNRLRNGVWTDRNEGGASNGTTA
ncbi:acylneuraminate cytidylyltransferase [Singulisphaera sp. Ch08]|uniref:N-acylneuraminate cytidylyltransferase n=1 Tax=Singulisphaera sp. Ch08 TaxID=3120278 RepID=A0AAU7CQQ9_9BACT